MTDGQTDGPTDRRTDRRTDGAGCRVACTRLKKVKPTWKFISWKMKLRLLNFSLTSKSASGNIFYLMVLGLYAHELCKNAKKCLVKSFLSQTLCETAVWEGKKGPFAVVQEMFSAMDWKKWCMIQYCFCRFFKILRLNFKALWLSCLIKEYQRSFTTLGYQSLYRFLA